MAVMKKFMHTLGFAGGIVISADAVCLLLYLFKVITILRLVALLYLLDVLFLPLIYGSIGVYYLMRKPGKSAEGIMLCALAALFLALFISISLIAPYDIHIEEHVVVSPYISNEIILVHISDIQSNAVGHYEERVFELLQDIPADIVLHTGDLVQPFYYWGYDVFRYEPELKKLAHLFRTLHPTYGIYNVIGDTELEHKIPMFDRLAGVTTLVDEHVIVSTDRGVLNILGLSLDASRRGAPQRIRQWTEAGNQDEFRIVMGHAPDYIMSLPDGGVDLCLAGHTHGGQIHLPFIGPLLRSSTIPKTWVRGFRPVNTLHINVSAGIGVSHAWGLPPMRFRCPPTITVLRVRPDRP